SVRSRVEQAHLMAVADNCKRLVARPHPFQHPRDGAPSVTNAEALFGSGKNEKASAFRAFPHLRRPDRFASDRADSPRCIERTSALPRSAQGAIEAAHNFIERDE